MTSEIINSLDKLVSQLKTNKDILGDDFCNEVAKAGNQFIKELSESVGKKILHNLHEDKPTKERVEAIITALPSVLSVKNNKGRIPIQQACWFHDSVEYVGLLAREGIKYNVGGEGKRGGLLLEDPTAKDNRNTLQLLTDLKSCFNQVKWDALYRDALEDLWESGLLTAADIIEYNLLFYSCRNKRQRRFEYLSDMYPEALKKPDNDGKVIFHAIIEQREANDESIQIFLRTALKHFPNELGLLFQKDRRGRTAVEVAISRHDKDTVFKAIRQCIPPDTSLPILHHVVKHAPQYISDFTFYYPNAVYLKDEHDNNRTYFQARIASGNTTFAKDAEFLTLLPKMKDELEIG